MRDAAFRAADSEGDELYDPELVLSLHGKSCARISLGEFGKALAAGEGAFKMRHAHIYYDMDASLQKNQRGKPIQSPKAIRRLQRRARPKKPTPSMTTMMISPV